MSDTQTKPFFVGEFTHSVDKAGRVTIPSQWRLKGDGQSYLGIPMPDGTVRVLPPWQIEALREKVSEMAKLSDLAGHRALTSVFSSRIPLNATNRVEVVLTERMRRHVGLKERPY